MLAPTVPINDSQNPIFTTYVCIATYKVTTLDYYPSQSGATEMSPMSPVWVTWNQSPSDSPLWSYSEFPNAHVPRNYVLVNIYLLLHGTEYGNSIFQHLEP